MPSEKTDAEAKNEAEAKSPLDAENGKTEAEKEKEGVNTDDPEAGTPWTNEAAPQPTEPPKPILPNELPPGQVAGPAPAQPHD